MPGSRRPTLFAVLVRNLVDNADPLQPGAGSYHIEVERSQTAMCG